MLITSIIAIILTTISLGYLITWIFHLYPTFPGYPFYNYFGAVIVYGLISSFCWLVARGYYLEYKKEAKTNTDSS